MEIEGYAELSEELLFGNSAASSAASSGFISFR
jgi:hypothetical protein